VTDNLSMTRGNTRKVKKAWIASLVVALTTVILIAVLLTWRYEHRCNVWEAKVNEQRNEMFSPAYADVYTTEEIESLARLALDHERPPGC
jgi:cytochrome c-type biogenesis protein CcmH/NrfG